MNPMIVEPPATVKNRPPCSSCLHPAEIVWIDQWGTVPLCRTCGDNRQKAWENHQQKEKK